MPSPVSTGLSVVAFALLLTPCISPASAATLHVPSQYPTIQAGIDAASTGDSVLVAPGTYTGDGNRDIVLSGRDLVIRSEAGATATVIDCGGTAYDNHTGVSFDTATGATEFDGFTIRNGYTELPAGAIAVDSCSPTIRSCVFEGNTGTWAGAVWILGGSPVITGCTFASGRGIGGGLAVLGGSQAAIASCIFLTNEGNGGGIYCLGSSPEVTDCVFAVNHGYAYGGAISFEEDSHPVVRRCTFTSNSARLDAGAVFCGGCSPRLEECSFRNNDVQMGGGDVATYLGSVTLTSCRFDSNEGYQRWGAYCLTGETLFEGCTFTGTRSAFECEGSHSTFRGCTFVGNHSTGFANDGAVVELDRCIIAFGGAAPIGCSGGGEVSASCSDVFGNAGGDWVGCLAGQEGLSGNISADPLFCDLAGGDFRLYSHSPCAPAQQPECGLIGAFEVGCGPTAAEHVRWGAMKQLFR